MNDQRQTLQDNSDSGERERLRGVTETLTGAAHFQEALDALERLEQQLLELPGRLQYLNSRRVTYDVAIGTAIGQLTQRLRVAAEDARAIAERESHHILPRIEAVAAILQGDQADRDREGDVLGTEEVTWALEEADTL
jgi:cell division septum initiation protein DivIVA